MMGALESWWKSGGTISLNVNVVSTNPAAPFAATGRISASITGIDVRAGGGIGFGKSGFSLTASSPIAGSGQYPKTNGAVLDTEFRGSVGAASITTNSPLGSNSFRTSTSLPFYNSLGIGTGASAMGTFGIRKHYPR
jgi:hypothetical protein